MSDHCSVPWCEEGDHILTRHKRLLGQWHTLSITDDEPREITVQLELWARYDIPVYIRGAMTMVDSANLRQWDCELTSAQAKDMAYRFNEAASELSG